MFDMYACVIMDVNAWLGMNGLREGRSS